MRGLISKTLGELEKIRVKKSSSLSRIRVKRRLLYYYFKARNKKPYRRENRTFAASQIFHERVIYTITNLYGVILLLSNEHSFTFS